jgi:hypothetical protein
MLKNLLYDKSKTNEETCIVLLHRYMDLCIDQDLMAVYQRMTWAFTSARVILLPERMINRSTTLRNSRMLPVQ